MCTGRSQEDSAPFEGDCGSCWAEAGDSPHGALNCETHPGLQVPMHGAPHHRHFSCLMPWCHGPRGHRRASGGGGRGNNHAPGRPRIRSKPWALPLLLRAGTSSPRSPLRPRTCSVTWGKLLSLRAAHLTYKAGMATCTFFTGCWYSGLEPTSGAVELSSLPHPHRAQTVITGLGTSLVLCEPLFPLPPPLVVSWEGPEDTPRGGLW